MSGRRRPWTVTTPAAHCNTPWTVTTAHKAPSHSAQETRPHKLVAHKSSRNTAAASSYCHSNTINTNDKKEPHNRLLKASSVAKAHT